MNLRYSFLLFLVFISFSCSLDLSSNEPIPVINIDDVRNEDFPFDKYTVTPIFLEETDESFLASINHLILDNEKLYIVENSRDGNNELFIFDVNGNFINRLSAGEPGSEGYFKRVFDFVVEDGIIEILDVNQRKILSFNEDGKLLSDKNITIQAKTFAKINDRYIFRISQRSEAEAVYATYKEDLTEERFYIYPPQSIRDIDAFRSQNEFAIVDGKAYFSYPLSRFVFESTGKTAPDTVLELVGSRLAPEDIQYKEMMEAGQQLMKSQAYALRGNTLVFDKNLLVHLTAYPEESKYLSVPLSKVNSSENAGIWEIYDTAFDGIILEQILFTSPDQMVILAKPIYDQDPKIFDRYDIEPGYENPILLLVSKK